MDEINVDKELIDYESATSSSTDNGQPATTNNTGSVSAPSGRSGWRQHDAGTAAGDGPKQLRRTSRAIGNTLADIASGRTVGQYPAIESIYERGTQPAPRPQQRRSRRRLQQGAYEGFAAASDRRLIADIRPPLPERVAILEHEQGDTDTAVGQLRTDAFLEIHAVEKRDIVRTTAVDHRIDIEVLPMIKDVQHRGTVKTTVSIIALLLSLAANIIALYRYLTIHL